MKNHRKIIKKTLSLSSGFKSLITERDNLKKFVKEEKEKVESLEKENAKQKRQTLELGKKVEALAWQRNNPKNSEDYINATNSIFQIKKSDIEKSNKTTAVKLKKANIANWFIPNFKHITFGGLFTIFRLMEKLSQEGLTNRVIIYNDKEFDVSTINSQIKENFKSLKSYEIITFNPTKQDVNILPSCDIAFCTLWNSAYLLLKFNKTKHKYYFIQDYEPLFYPAGSTSALVESTYRFGFKAIVNTKGLFTTLKDRHNISGMYFTPSIDEKIYYPPKKKNNEKIRIFFYARPQRARNGFGLGIETIKKLLKKYGNNIEIVTAGADWDESDYGLKNKIINLGLLNSIKEVAELYRTCDIGFCFMLTRHPSYQPLEFMASGVATVSNMNETNTWLLKHNKNCLISEPSPEAMAATIGKLVDSPLLREEIIKNGLELIRETSWEKQLDAIWGKMKRP